MPILVFKCLSCFLEEEEKKKKGFLDLCQVILARFLITEKFENWTSFYYNLNCFLIN